MQDCRLRVSYISPVASVPLELLKLEELQGVRETAVFFQLKYNLWLSLH
jgi:hypothetical protein